MKVSFWVALSLAAASRQLEAVQGLAWNHHGNNRDVPLGNAVGGGLSRPTDRRILLTSLVASATAGATFGWFAGSKQQPAHAATMQSSTTLLTAAGKEESATAAAATELQDVYFGVGCFWHIMHVRSFFLCV